VAGFGFTGVYVDANAVSPQTAREIGSAIETRGGSYVDGGIVGAPPRKGASERLEVVCPREILTEIRELS
jgi:3-hydroxyisobutyrate dehydrogenase-like beta-hydroxyacid dehydrogenase